METETKPGERRTVFAKDVSRSVSGFPTHESAVEVARTIKEDDDTRVRVRHRSRTGLYDVVVKVRREAT